MRNQINMNCLIRFLNDRIQILPLGEMNLPDDWIMPDHY